MPFTAGDSLQIGKLKRSIGAGELNNNAAIYRQTTQWRSGEMVHIMAYFFEREKLQIKKKVGKLEQADDKRCNHARSHCG